MSRKSTLQILHSHITMSIFSTWFVVGLLIGVSAWTWGCSPLPALALSVAAGFGWLLIFALCTTVALALTALLMKNRAAYLAYYYFQKLLPWVFGKLLRSTSVFFGLVAVAAVCSIVSGSEKAFLAALLGGILGSTLMYCWCGLSLISDELTKRTGHT